MEDKCPAVHYMKCFRSPIAAIARFILTQTKE